MNQLMTSEQLTMSSREIADLTGSTHDNVLKTVRLLIEKGVVSRNDTPYIPYTHPQNGQVYFEFLLNYRDTMVVVSGYSVELRATIIDRWQELESQKAPALPSTYREALVALLASEDAKEQAMFERDQAVTTKAEIGNRREATAMNTASQAVKKVAALQVQLDTSAQFCTIKRMQMLKHGQPFDWRKLKHAGAEMGIDAIDVFDQNYGTVKAYHEDVWLEVYGLRIEA